MSEYLEFKQIPFKGKTNKYHIISKSSGFVLGLISWYPQWRCYTFSPAYPTTWNIDCLEDVKIFLQQLRDERNKIKCECGIYNSCTTNGKTCAKCGRLI
jgi:hypothetical protein